MGRVIPAKAAMWAGHYSTFILLAAVAASVAYDAAGRPGGGVIDWAMDVAWLAWVASFTADARVHRERLCERCIAASPLDPQAVVTRWRQVLRLHHDRRTMIVIYGAIVAWDLGSASLFRHPSAWALAVDALTVSVLGATYVVTWQHRRLYPWCPFCSWGDGGPQELSPDIPVPSEGAR
jgi:hypothetical protein